MTFAERWKTGRLAWKQIEELTWKVQSFYLEIMVCENKEGEQVTQVLKKEKLAH